MDRLAEEYRRQFQWRDWETALGELPSVQGQTILDLGCGAGDLAAELSSRGARVIGFDASEELLQFARGRQIAGAEFRLADLREDVEFGVMADGIWCSFAAAYFVDLPTALTRWTGSLKPGGWIALSEIDDLFGHEPLAPRTKALLGSYCDEGFAAGRYDFHAGRKLAGHLESAGLLVTESFPLQDREFCFDGPADAAVLAAWRARFARMRLLREFLGQEADQVMDEFLECLSRADHRSNARVCFCLGVKPGD